MRRLTCSLLLTLSLSACISMSGPTTAQPARTVCIEANSSVLLDDFIPSLQSELLKRNIQSRMSDTQAANCSAILSYTGYVKWDMKMFTKDYTPYLAYAVLTLRSNGQVLGMVQYHSNQLGLDKWSETSRKLGPLIDQLLPYIPFSETGRATLPAPAHGGLSPSTN